MKPIQEIAKRLEALQQDSSKKTWTKYTTGYDFGVLEAQEKINELLKERDSYKIVSDALESDLDEVDRRRVEILHRSFKPYHLSERVNALRLEIQALVTKLSDILNKHRTVVRGQEMTATEIERTLSQNPDRDLRKDAFLARAQVNRKLVDGGFIELVRLRKEQALAAGAKDYIDWKLESQDLSSDIFDGWKDDCRKYRKAYQETRKRLGQEILGVDRVMPWDQAFIKGKICPRDNSFADMIKFREPIDRVFSRLGFEIANLPLTYDIFPRKNKSEWGYNFAVELGRDCRILANVDNRISCFWVLLHETAHGVHYLGLDPDETILNFGVSGIVAEGFANFFGDLQYSKEFVSEFFPQDLDGALTEFKRLEKSNRVDTVASLAICLFDQDLYRNDIENLQDIHDLRWSCERELLGQEPYADEPVWGRLIHHTTHPIYLHNYFLGDVMTESMKKAFAKKNGVEWHERPKDFGTMWKEEVLRPSGRYSFQDLYQRVCGEKPSIGAFLASCTS